MRKFFGLCKFIPLTLCFVSFAASGELTKEQTEKLLKELSLPLVLLTTPERVGTAFVINTDTYTVVTNVHNLKDKHGKINIDQISLKQPQKPRSIAPLFLRPFASSGGKVIGIKLLSELHDLAVLKVSKDYYPGENVKRDDLLTPPAPGAVVYTMGYPQGKFDIFKGSLVSTNNTEYIVALNGDGLHGMSGAPLYSERGILMGVITRLAGHNIAHATPIKYLKDMTDKLPSETRFKRKWGGGTKYIPDNTIYKKILRVVGTHWRIFNAYPSLYWEAKKGNALAYFRAGEVLRDKGEDLKAFHMFEKAAAGGSQNAQFALATLYVQRGEKEKAIALLEDMLAANYPPAFYNLGVLYLEEEKTHPENFQKAYDMFSRATEKYHSGAMYNMGLMLWKGHGVEQNVEKAKKLFELAALLNFEPAKEFLRSIENPNLLQHRAGEYSTSPAQIPSLKRQTCKEVWQQKPPQHSS